MAKILIIDDGNYSKRIEEALAGHTVMKCASPREAGAGMASEKPQLVFMPEARAFKGAALRTMRGYPFVPFMTYGEFGKTPEACARRVKKLLAAGYASCINGQTIIDRISLAAEIEKVLWKSLAAESIWDKERSITLEDRRSEKKRNAAAAVTAAAAALLLGFVLIGKIVPEQKLVPRMYQIPYSGISGLAVSGRTVWGCDWKSQSVYEQTTGRKLAIKHVFAFPETRFAGIALGKDRLWTLDSWKKTINVHRLDDRLSIAQEVACPGESPDSITYDGKYLLVSDGAENKVFVIKPEENYAVLKEFPLPGSFTSGIYADGKYLWVLDSQDNKLYKCRFTDFELKVEGIFIPPDYENFKATVIGGDVDYLWLASEKESRIYRYPKKFLESL
jgi:hypothetical protein